MMVTPNCKDFCVKSFLFLFLVMFFSGCSVTNPYDDYPEIQPTIDKILSANKDNILTPSNSNYLKSLKTPQDYSFKLVEYDFMKPAVDGSIYFHKVIKQESDKTYFGLISTSPKYGTEITHYKIENNMTYYFLNDRYLEAGTDQCSFVLGKCQYVDFFSREVRYAETIFDKGLWITTYTTPTGVKIKKATVFDKFGLPLYKYSSSSLISKPMIEVRVKQSEQDIMFVNAIKLDGIKL